MTLHHASKQWQQQWEQPQFVSCFKWFLSNNFSHKAWYNFGNVCRLFSFYLSFPLSLLWFSRSLSTSLTTSLRQLLCHLASLIPVWAPWYDYYYAYKTHKSPTQNVLVRQKTAADFSALINSTHSKLNNKNNIRSDIMNIWEALFNWISFCLSVL